MAYRRKRRVATFRRRRFGRVRRRYVRRRRYVGRRRRAPRSIPNRGAMRPELKALTVGSTNAFFSTAFGVAEAPTSSINQGLTWSDRIGTVIVVKKLQVWCDVTASPTNPTRFERCHVVFWKNRSTATTATWSDILDSTFATKDSGVFLNKNRDPRWKVLKTVRFQASPYYINNAGAYFPASYPGWKHRILRKITLRFPRGLRVAYPVPQYTSTDQGLLTNKLYFNFLGENTGATPVDCTQIRYWYRIWFTDA